MRRTIELRTFNGTVLSKHCSVVVSIVKQHLANDIHSIDVADSVGVFGRGLSGADFNGDGVALVQFGFC